MIFKLMVAACYAGMAAASAGKAFNLGRIETVLIAVGLASLHHWVFH